jgi:hypothetical protein
MTVTHKWAVSQLDCYPEYEGYKDVAFTAHWRMDGTDGDHTAGVYGSVGLTLDPEAKFAPFEKLTEAQVIGWVKDALGEEQVASYEENVANQIDALINPLVVRPSMPWAARAAEKRAPAARGSKL